MLGEEAWTLEAQVRSAHHSHSLDIVAAVEACKAVEIRHNHSFAAQRRGSESANPKAVDGM